MRDISIEIKNLYYKYPDGYEALKHIDLTLYKGESLGIVGPNGAGKSTLLLQLTGINRPSSGKIEINSLEVNKKNLSQIRKDIGFVFQNPEDQLFTTSIYEDVAFGPKNYKLSREEVDKRVTESLKKVGILELKNRAPYRLSGGQKNLAAIATAISMNPSILIMDEPTSALDPISTSKIEDLAVELKKDYTIVMVTHNMQQAARISDKTAFFLLGEVIEFGETEQIFSMPKNKKTEDYITGRFG